MPQVIYIVWTIYMTFISIRDAWPSWVAATIIFGAIMSHVVIYIKGKRDKFSLVFMSVMIWMNVLLYTVFSHSFIPILATIATVMVMLSLYDILILNYISVAATAVLIIVNTFIFKNVDLSIKKVALSNIMQFVALFLLEYIEITTLKIRLQAEANLEKSLEEQKVLEQGKDDFMANISHEIRTPLNIICGANELLINQRLGGDLDGAVEDSYTAGQKLRTLVADILDFTELMQDSVTISEEPYTLTSVINDVINMTYSWNKEKKLEFIVDCQADIPEKLIGDSQKIYRIMLHLLNNAVKFTERGGFTLTVSSRKEEYGVNLIIVVEDTGIGISESDMENIERVYNQLDSKRDRQNSGVGIGLAITKRLVEKMNGFMHIESKYGEGTVITVSIPQKVESYENLISIKEPENIYVLFYLDIAKYETGRVRDSYLTTAHHIAEQLKLAAFRCNNQAELERRAIDKEPTHILTAYYEYMEAKAFYDNIAKRVKVLVIADASDDLSVVATDVQIIFKPIQAFSFAAALNGENVAWNGREGWHDTGHFTVGGAKVLVVDDSPMNLNVVNALLKGYGINIERSESGADAIEKVKQKRYDLVFMDHMMPEMDGVECLHFIRQLPIPYAREMPIVALTANAVSGAREMLLGEGFNDFVAKPIEKTNMERILRKYLSDYIRETKNPVQYVEPLKTDTPKLMDLPFTEPAKVSEPAKETEPLKVAEPIRTPEPVIVAKERLLPSVNKDGFPLVEGYDWDAALETLGDYELLRETLDIYYESLSETLETLEKYINDANNAENEEDRSKALKEYRVSVHALKSSSLTVGAKDFSAFAKKLELLANDGELEELTKLHPDIAKDIKTHIDLLSKHVPFSEGI